MAIWQRHRGAPLPHPTKQNQRKARGEGTRSEAFPYPQAGCGSHSAKQKVFHMEDFWLPHDGERREARREGTHPEAFPSHKPSAKVISQEANLNKMEKILHHGDLATPPRCPPSTSNEAKTTQGEGRGNPLRGISLSTSRPRKSFLRIKKSFTCRTFGIPHDGKRCKARGEGTRSEEFPSHIQTAEVISQEAKSLSHGGLSAFPTMERDARRGEREPTPRHFLPTYRPQKSFPKKF